MAILYHHTFAIAAVLLSLPFAVSIPFDDVSVAVGFTRPHGRRLKYGGAAVADLDGDGFPDFVLGHHDHYDDELYFNNANGSFSKSSWGGLWDTHGLNPFRPSTTHRTMHFTLSQGGSNGNYPAPPVLFTAAENRTVTIMPLPALHRARGRGRSAVFLHLRTDPRAYPDVLFTNKPMGSGNSASAYQAFAGSMAGQLLPQELSGFGYNSNSFGSVIDVDGDGLVELITFPHLQVHRVVGFFEMQNVTLDVLPAELRLRDVTAVAELDYDNDGRWDLFVVCAPATWQTNIAVDKPNYVAPVEYLLRNVGGRFEDVSDAAGIPRTGKITAGVTIGDLDNDGWVDIMLVRRDSPNMLLINSADGSFTAKNARLGRPVGVHGDMATAVDYDRDGRLDLLLSEGDHMEKPHGGFYRLLRNVMTHPAGMGGFLLVRVGNAVGGGVTSLHAVVRVRARVDGAVMLRRVGSPGTAVSNSYIELVHFGLGEYDVVHRVSVTWTDGTRTSVANVTAGSLLTMGEI